MGAHRRSPSAELLAAAARFEAAKEDPLVQYKSRITALGFNKDFVTRVKTKIEQNRAILPPEWDAFHKARRVLDSSESPQTTEIRNAIDITWTTNPVMTDRFQEYREQNLANLKKLEGLLD